MLPLPPLLCLFVMFLVGLKIFLAKFVFRRKRLLKRPPGPLGLPFLGTTLSLGEAPHLVFERWARKYGPIVRTKFGTTEVIVINDSQLLREAFNQPALTGRCKNPTMTIFSDGHDGVISANGQDWVEQRRFTLRTLRDFGFGKQSMESLITDEVQDVIKWIKKTNGKPAEVDGLLIAATVNSLWTIVSGERHDQGCDEVAEILSRLNTVIESVFRKNILLFLFPQLIERLPKIFLRGWYKSLEDVKPLLTIFKNTIKEHAKVHEVSDHPRDFIDVYMTEMKNCLNPISSFYGQKGFDSLLGVVSDLHSAGQATTSTTIVWAILYLTHYPAVQSKLQDELIDVIGRNRLPTLADRPNLPYTEAFMSEVMRFSSITPMGVFRMAVEDTVIGGYDVPKGTQVVGNFYGVHYSRDIWGDPEVFRPERFLTNNEKTFVKSEHLMPFGFGKRVCLGETLARDTYFLFLASIVQQFHIAADPANPKPTLAPRCGLLMEPEKFKAVFTEIYCN